MASDPAELSAEDREVIELLLNNRDLVLVPDILALDGYVQDMATISGLSVVAIRRDDLLDARLVGILSDRADTEQLARALLLWDRAVRDEMAALLAAGQTGASTTEAAPADTTEAQSAPDLVPDLVPGMWKGALDDAAKARELARFNAATGAQLEVYEADEVSLVLDAEAGTVEIEGTPMCEVHTVTQTSDGRDAVFVRTITRYSTDGPTPLHDRTFDVRVSVTRTSTDQKGRPVGPQGTTETFRQATLTKPDGTGTRQLIMYNGQPSVHEVPWLMVPSSG
ncbi:hypothetical protein E7811_04275 [Aliigemmobacter aestuarii]|uniref:Uncharacterized protein n=1 Tax=Aliigemmobacter aestuarii TaxID=1445661 RepID=A0A4S3MR91_9RHOB|nr:hypothetical protein [Gemmobacter aestuarii]THD84947.1 hypothetical protein E7811_04275 [Gemmobacter aestuarii]